MRLLSLKALRILKESMDSMHILVVGDVILDRYIEGPVHCISREALVPIVSVERIRENLGGAGNALANLTGLGVRVSVCSALGRDPAGVLIREKLRQPNVRKCVLLERSLPTPVKVRVVSKKHQIARIDTEIALPLDDHESESLLTDAISILDSCTIDAVVISDYGLGVCSAALISPLVALSRKRGILVLVDPRGADWRKYEGATLVCPNLKELGDAARIPVKNDDDVVLSASRMVLDQFELQRLLVTRSKRGISLVSTRNVVHIPTRIQEVRDVSGAGDTVIACCAAFLTAGLDPEEAARIANIAAGIVVRKWGTIPIEAYELEDELTHGDKRGPSSGKIFSRTQILRSVAEWKKNGLRVVFTNGCFDIIHRGHIHCIECARSFGDKLVVAVNSDDSVHRLKGKDRLFIPQEDRTAILAAIQAVDAVVIFEEDTPEALLREMRPHILVKGGDYLPESLLGRKWVERVEIVPLVAGKSTTALIREIRKTTIQEGVGR